MTQEVNKKVNMARVKCGRKTKGILLSDEIFSSLCYKLFLLAVVELM